MGVTKPYQSRALGFAGLVTTGRMARQLGIDPKTLRRWADQGKVPCQVNPLNRYRYFHPATVRKLLGLHS